METVCVRWLSGAWSEVFVINLTGVFFIGVRRLFLLGGSCDLPGVAKYNQKISSIKVYDDSLKMFFGTQSP